MIRNTYSQCLSKVQGRDGSSDWLSIDSGVRQGDVLSPLLFIIYMDAAVREAREGEDRACETLVYAYDIAVATSDVRVLQSILDRWHRVISEKGMRINTRKGKTELIAVARNKRSTKLT